MPSMGYIYLPVGSKEMLEFASDWNTERKKRNEPELPVIATTSSGAVKVVRRLCGHGNLRFVGTTDTLYVIVHGAADGSRYIGADRGGHKDTSSVRGEWVGGTSKKWLPAEFAQHLAKEGLQKGFRDLRLLACGSGLKSDKADEPYGKGLYRALRALGYTNLEVVGYLGSVRFTGQHGLTVEYKSRNAAGQRTGGVSFESGGDYSITWR